MSLQEAIRTLEATRSEQQKLQRLADEREDELMQLRLQQRSVTGGQPPGLPNPWGMRMLEQAAQSQQHHEPLIRDVTDESHNPEILGGFCVSHIVQETGEGYNRDMFGSSPPRPVPVTVSHEYMTIPTTTPAARFPTLGELRGPSSSSLPTTNRVSHSAGYSWNESHSGSGPVPMAASARPTTVPQSSSHSGPTLADLWKVKTTLPVLQLQGNVAFNLIKTFKEWTLTVQATVGGCNERFPDYWISVLDKATAAYSRFCSLSPSERTIIEAEEQMRVIAGNYNTMVTSTNPLEIVLRQALCDALPQGHHVLVNGIVDSDKMLLDVMRKKLPSEAAFRLICQTWSNRQYRIEVTGTRVQLNSIKVFQVLRTFVSHVCKLDTTLSTKIVMLGDVTETMDIDQLTGWALRVLGVMADHAQQDKNMKQLFGSSASPPSDPKNTKSPQANAATPDPKGQGKGKGKETKGSKNEVPGQSQKPGKPQPQGQGPARPIPVTCKHFVTDQGCSKGSTCIFYHPRVGRDEHKCYNCGSKEHGIKECTRAKPTLQQLQSRGNGRGSSQPTKPPAKASPPAPGKGSGKNQKGPKGPKGKPKAKPSAASAEVEQPTEGARFCIRLKPRMKELIAEKCFVTSHSSQEDPVGSSANAGSREPDQGYALLDSGATHVILNLSKISPQGLREGRSIGIRLAAGKQVPSTPVVKRLQLKLMWHNEKCMLLARSSKDLGVWLPVIEPLIRNQLMYLSKDQFRAVRSLLYDSRLKLDETFYNGRWEQLLDLPSEDEAIGQAMNVQEEPDEKYPELWIYPENCIHCRAAKEILANTQREKKDWEYSIVPEWPIIKLREEVVASHFVIVRSMGTAERRTSESR
eukprot:5036058-Amphidinium_carterae.2